MATVQRYVNTASTAGGDGTTNATAGANRAYASLSEWEAAAGGSATDDYVVDCCGTAADTTAVTINFSPHITSGSITVRGNRSNTAGFYTGNSTISSAHYRLAPASGEPLVIEENNIAIDGIQIEAAGGAFASAINHVAPTNLAVRKCRLRAASATDNGIGTDGSYISDNGTRTFENNLIVGFNLNGIEIRVDNFFGPTCTVRDNSVYGDGSQVGLLIAEHANAASTYTIKGNAFANTGGSDAFSVTTTGTSTVTYNQNATEDNQGTTGEIAIGVLTDAWTSPGTTAGSDFSVKNTSSSLYNAVNPALATTDIADFARGSAPNDVGAFELQVAATVTIGRGTAR